MVSIGANCAGRTRGAVLLALCFLVDAFVSSGAFADSTFVYAVQISASLQATPPQITLSWKPDPYGANSYTVYRKAKEDTTWGSPIAALPGSGSSYADASVVVGTPYEYQVVKAGTLGYTGYGYIYSGINVPPIEGRGTLLLVVATNSTVGLDLELSRLHDDLVGDGWQVVRVDVSSNDTPESVHSQILNQYWADSADINTVFLLGHVPILESGYIDYDGHGPRPMPADAYYGDVSDDWPTAPGTSPNYIPSDVTLMVGRVDLANMPGQGAAVPWPSETDLLRNYLNKDHNWRTGQITVTRQALMGNRRGDEGGLATAASGYRNFDPLVGPGNTVEANIQDTAPAGQRWVSMLATGSYLWAYGCGGGQDTAIGYLGTHLTDYEVWSTDVVGQDAHGVFVMVFGSHFGNWDRPDNIMRSVLASPSVGLTCCMSGEPHWFCHHMGLGETIGYSTRLSVNNSTLYQNQLNPFTRAVYIALMGDPTLRMEPVLPPSGLNAGSDPAGVHLSWAPPEQTVTGYYVYRSATPDGPFSRISGSLVSDTTFTDMAVPPGTYTYLVRAVALITNPSGSYYDPSQGIFTTVTVQPPPPPPPISVQANRQTNALVLTWNTLPGLSYHVEATSDLVHPGWANVSGTLQASNSNLSWSDTSRPLTRNFYRVVSP